MKGVSRFDELFQMVTRDEVRGAEPYQVGQDFGFARMHQNECALPFGPQQTAEFFEAQAKQLLKSFNERDWGLNAYPSLSSEALVGAYAEDLDVPVDAIEVFAGSSDAIQTIASAFFRRSESVAFLRPSFSILSSLTTLWGARELPIELDSQFDVVPESLLREEVLNAPIIILCSPNNPTGRLISPDLVSAICTQAKGLVVIDEAYFEFAQARFPDLQSYAPRAALSENLLVLRTLSKAWGAAGLRIGALVGNPKWIQFLRALKKPYSVSLPAEILGLWMLREQKHVMKMMVANSVDQCHRIEKAFDRLVGHFGKEQSLIRYWKSSANFVLLESVFATQIMQRCYERKILIRDLGTLGGLRGHDRHFLRVSPWTDQSVSELLQVIDDVVLAAKIT